MPDGASALQALALGRYIAGLLPVTAPDPADAPLEGRGNRLACGANKFLIRVAAMVVCKDRK